MRSLLMDMLITFLPGKLFTFVTPVRQSGSQFIESVAKESHTSQNMLREEILVMMMYILTMGDGADIQGGKDIKKAEGHTREDEQIREKKMQEDMENNKAI